MGQYQKKKENTLQEHGGQFDSKFPLSYIIFDFLCSQLFVLAPKTHIIGSAQYFTVIESKTHTRVTCWEQLVEK